MVGDPKTSQPHRKRVQPVLRLQGGSRSSLVAVSLAEESLDLVVRCVWLDI
jgi:hypothetical protein